MEVDRNLNSPLPEILAFSGKRKIILEPGNLNISVIAEDEEWHFAGNYEPGFYAGDEYIPFISAGEIRHNTEKSGIGEGIRSFYAGFPGFPGFSFETFVWIEESTGDVFFEWIPLSEEIGIREVCWPGPMDFEERSPSYRTFLNEGQGLMIPNDWPAGSRPLHFQGMFLTAGSYMPWFGQIRDNAGYIAIAITPWNGRVSCDHPAGGPYTHVWASWQPSLGVMSGRRILRYSFLKNCDHNDLCKVYRHYVVENGLACTLKEKEARIPAVRKLYGAAFVHTGIKTHFEKDSASYDPEREDTLVSFRERKEQMEELQKNGAPKLFLHLDGWAQPGYDNRHPDYLPVCAEAGGNEGLRELIEVVQAGEGIFCLHDQYRDFYHNAPSYSEDYACRSYDGSVPSHARWAGGPQSYLCGSFAPYYVRRNYTELMGKGVKPDAAYLDVFTCNEGDECANPRHRMTRRDCLEYRGKCFDYLISQGIMPGSEEVSDWSMRNLVFCHYAPYSFQLSAPEEPLAGVPVPLFSLVYHDCVVVPWMMEKMGPARDYMLYALLNGGAPYLIRDPAYPNVDGAFRPREEMSLQEMIARCREVCHLHERVADLEMVRHEFPQGDYSIQKTTFSDGTQVEVCFPTGSYTITWGPDLMRQGDEK